MADIESAKKKARRRGVGRDADGGGYRRHVLVCIGDSCAKSREGKDCLKAFRKAAKELEANGDGPVLCTAVDCLQICRVGPLAIIYPSGAWYHSLTPEAAAKILRDDPETKARHLLAENPLQ